MVIKTFFTILAFILVMATIIFVYAGDILNVNSNLEDDIYVPDKPVVDMLPNLTIEDPAPSVVATDPAYSSSYALYDNFNMNSGGWSKRSNTWSSSYAYTIFDPSNVWYEDGKLVLRSYVDDHMGGEYKSDDKYSYGKYRASIKVDQTPGTYLTFYSYQWPTGANREGHNEIDIEIQKIDGKYTALFSTWVEGVKSRYMYYMPFDPSEKYHTYGYNWYPDRVEFYIDDMSKPIWTSRSNIPGEPMYVYFQNWVQRDVPSDHGNGVNTEYVDWVTVELY
jgi:beta-glucanase (GH16 family)